MHNANKPLSHKAEPQYGAKEALDNGMAKLREGKEIQKSGCIDTLKQIPKADQLCRPLSTLSKINLTAQYCTCPDKPLPEMNPKRGQFQMPCMWSRQR